MVEKIGDKIPEDRSRTIIIPEARMAADVLGRETNSLGVISIPGQAAEARTERFELYISKEPDFDLNLYAKDEYGHSRQVIQLLTDYDDRLGAYQGVIVTKDLGLYTRLSQNIGFSSVIDTYLEKVKVLGRWYFEKRTRESNSHKIRLHEVRINNESRRIELIHQQQGGDCVLANYLNTFSFERGGQIPATITEARVQAIAFRNKKREDASDIRSPDSPLSYTDVVNLFSSIYGKKPRQEDIVLLDGHQSQNIIQVQVLELLDKLDRYPSGILATGLGYHSRTIKKLPGDAYAVLDPMNRNGFEVMNTIQLVGYITGLSQNQSSNQNFFFFVRK